MSDTKTTTDATIPPVELEKLERHTAAQRDRRRAGLRRNDLWLIPFGAVLWLIVGVPPLFVLLILAGGKIVDVVSGDRLRERMRERGAQRLARRREESSA